MPLVDVMVHRHQLDGGDAERREVPDGRLRREAEIRAAQRFGHVRVELA